MQISGKSFAAGVLVTMVLGSGTAYAATGGNFILGKSNRAGATTTLTNPNGTALALSSKAGTASLKVNSKTRVANLNADMLDNLNSTHFARAHANTGVFWSTSIEKIYDQDGVTPIGAVAWVDCPAGTVVTGGSAFSYDGSFILDNFKEGNSWIALTDNPDATEGFGANVVCWNPKGKLASQSFRTAPNAELRESARRAIR